MEHKQPLEISLEEKFMILEDDVRNLKLKLKIKNLEEEKNKLKKSLMKEEEGKVYIYRNGRRIKVNCDIDWLISQPQVRLY